MKAWVAAVGLALLFLPHVGLAQASCSTSLQAQIDAAPAGSTLVPAPCIYREWVRVTKPLTIDGQGKAEIRGSDVWPQWTQVGATWVSSLSVPPSKPDASAADYVDKAKALEAAQVFIDGQLAAFTLDGSRHVVLTSDPAGRLVEVSTRDRWLSPQANDVVVARMTLKHAMTMAQDLSIGSENRDGFVLRDSHVSDTHGSAVSPSGSWTQILNNTIERVGNVAVGSYQDRNTTIRGNTISQSGIGGWDWGWQGGAVKMVASTGLLMEGNTVRDNVGPGLWCDISCTGTIIRNNVVSGNSGPGIFYEISSSATINGNRVSSDSGFWPAIYVSSSADVDVYGNVVQASRGIQAYEDPRQQVANVNIHDNVMVALAQNNIMLFMAGGDMATRPSNRGSSNRYWYPGGENGQIRFAYGAGYSSLREFNLTRAGQGSRYLTDAEKAQILSGVVPTMTPVPPPTATLVPATLTPVPPTATAAPTATPVPTLVPQTTTILQRITLPPGGTASLSCEAPTICTLLIVTP